MSDFSLEPTGVTPPPPLSERTSVWRAATIVLAVLCVGLGFWLFRATDGFGSSGDDSPEAMVSMACSIAGDIDAELRAEGPGVDDAVRQDFDRLMAVTALAGLAAAEDPAFRELYEIVTFERISPGGELSVLVQDSQAYCAER